MTVEISLGASAQALPLHALVPASCMISQREYGVILSETATACLIVTELICHSKRNEQIAFAKLPGARHLKSAR